MIVDKKEFQLLKVIQRTELFQTLDSEEARYVLSLCERRDFEPNEVVWQPQGNIPSYLEDTGEVNWLVGDAMQMEGPMPVIAQAVMQLFASRDGAKHWARAIAMMRHGFVGHPYGNDDGIARERRRGRVCEIYREEEYGEMELQPV